MNSDLLSLISLGANKPQFKLDENKKIPEEYLPSYVDDVIELLALASTEPSTCSKGDKYYNITSKKIFTATANNTWGSTGKNPEDGKIYLDTSTTPSTSYRWSGSEMIVIGQDLSNYVTLDSAQTITGAKTFSTLPVSSVAPTSDSQLSNKKYVDDEVTKRIMHYSTMPTASSDNVGQIVQYIGTTTNDYTNGYFYKCVENSSVYSWENINIQASGGIKIYLLTTQFASATQSQNLNSDDIATLNEVIEDYRAGKEFILIAKKMMFKSSGDNTAVYNYNVQGIVRGSNKSFYIDFYRNTAYATTTRPADYEDNSIIRTITLLNVATPANISSASLPAQPTLSTANNIITVGNTASYTPTGDYNPAHKKYVDDAVSSRIAQYSTMPTASSSNEGSIVQFIGTTDSTYTNGYFYQCVSDGAVTPTYSWEAVNTQANPSVNIPVYVITGENQASVDALNACCNLFDQGKPFALFLLWYSSPYTHYYPVEIRKMTNTSYMFKAGIAQWGFATNGATFTYVYFSAEPFNAWGSFTSIKLTGPNRGLGEFTVANAYDASTANGALPANNTVSFTPTGNYNPATKKYVDDSVSAKVVQYSSIPAANSTNVGKIVQFTGTTNSTYTNGYFYKCVSDGQNPATYSWENVNVQASSGGGGNAASFLIDYEASAATKTATAQAIIDYYNTYGAMPLIQYKKYSEYITIEFVELATSYNAWKFNVWQLKYESNEYFGTPNMQYYGSIWFNYTTDQNTITSVDFIETNYERVFRPLAAYGSIYGGPSGSDYYKNACSALSVSNSNVYTPTGDYNPATKLYVDNSIQNVYIACGLSAYNSSSTYAVGDYVYKDNVVYVCSTAISTAEDWTAAHWTSSNLKAYLQNELIGNALGGSY